MVKRRGRNPIAHKLRANPSPAERLLWSRLSGNQLGATFVRQWQIGSYFATFAARSKKLAIEVDGGQFANERSESARIAASERFCFKILCFWEIEVLKDVDAVVDQIEQALDEIKTRKNGVNPRIEWPEIS